MPPSRGRGRAHFARRAVVLAALFTPLTEPLALGQTHNWASPASGLFNDAANWLPAGAPTDADDASITFGPVATLLTVSVPTATSSFAHSLTLDTATATLAVDGSLAVSNFVFLQGDATGQIDLKADGTLTLGTPTPQGGGVRRAFANLGNFNLASADPAADAVTIGANTRLAIRGGSTDTAPFGFRTGARNLDNRGVIRFGGLDAGVTSAPLRIYIRDLGAGTNRVLTNHGTLEFTATHTASVPADVARIDLINSGIVNESDGVVNFETNTSVKTNPSTAFPLVNRGIVNVASGANVLMTVTMEAGTLNLDEGSALRTSRFTYAGGTVNGTVLIESDQTGLLAFAEVPSASGRYVVGGPGVTLGKPVGQTTGGNVPAGATVAVQIQPQTGSVSLVSGNRSLTNFGTLSLEAKTGAISGDAEFNLGSITNTLTNHGTIVATAGVLQGGIELPGANRRRIVGTLQNAADGAITIAPNVEFTAGQLSSNPGASVVNNSGVVTIGAGGLLRAGTFTQTAGSISASGSIVTNRFDYVGGHVGSLTIQPLGLDLFTPLSVILPSVVEPGTSLRFIGAARLALRTGAATDPVTIPDTLTIISESASAASTPTAAGRDLINFGTVVSRTSLTSSLGKSFTNHGTLNFEPDAQASTTQPDRVFNMMLNNASDGVVNVGDHLHVSCGLNSFITNKGVVNVGSQSELQSILRVLINEGLITFGAGSGLVALGLDGRGALTFVDDSLIRIDHPTASAGAVTVSAGAFKVNENLTFTADRLRAAGDLIVDAGGTFQLRQNGTEYAASRVNTLALGQYDDSSPIGSVDIADNLLVVTGTAQFDTVIALRAFGLTASGLQSAMALANPRLEIGIVRAEQLASGPFSFLEQPVEGDDVLIRTTLRGDVNIDAQVGFDDLVALAQHYNQSAGQTWADGDTNYDGAVNFIDLVALAQNYNTSFAGGSIVPTPAAATGTFAPDFAADWALAQSLVPEPALLSVIGATSAMLSGRRRSI